MSVKAKKNVRYHLGIPLIGMLFLLLFALGTVCPDYWWATHFPAFLPPAWKVLLFATSGALIAWPLFFFKKNVGTPGFKIPQASGNAKWIIGGITLGMGCLLYTFPIAVDCYGNSYLFTPKLEQTVTEFPTEALGKIFSFGFNPEHGRHSMAAVVELLTYIFGTTYGGTFSLLNVGFGMAFVALWLLFVNHYFSSPNCKIILALCGLSAPFLQIYFGHIEVYAPIYFGVLLWGIGVVKFVESPSSKKLWAMVLLQIMLIKMHALGLMLIPGFLLMVAFYLKWRFSRLGPLLCWKGVAKFLLLPIFAAGVFVYFIILNDHRDPRILDGVADSERIFLPIFPPESPYDRYNLQSFNHIFDFGNVLLFWSTTGLFVLAVIIFFFRKKIRWNRPELLITGTGLLMMGTFLFMFNPLLTMMIDWDVFCLPGPLLLVFVAVVARQIQNEPLFAKKLLLPTIGLALMTVPIIVVNAHREPLSYRLESVGVRTFKTYYEWSGKYIHQALGLIENDMDLYLERKAAILEKLKPYTVPGKDFKYAQLLTDNGLYYLRFAQDPQQAKSIFEEARYYAPDYGLNLQHLIEAHLALQEHDEAFEISKQLIRLQFPDVFSAYRMAIYTGLGAEKRDEVLTLCNQYLAAFPQQEVFAAIKEDLIKGIETKQILKQLEQH